MLDPTLVAVFRDTLARGLSVPDADDLRARMTLRHVEDGHAVVKQGQPAGGLIFLCEGRLAVQLDVDGAVLDLGRISVGAIAGEVSFVDGGPATASLIGDGPCAVLELSLSELRRIREQRPAVATAVVANLVRVMADRVEHTGAGLLEVVQTVGAAVPDVAADTFNPEMLDEDDVELDDPERTRTWLNGAWRRMFGGTP